MPPPKLIVTRAAASPNMFVPGTLLAVALIGLLIAALSALAAKRTDRFAGVGHAWREAAWRTSGDVERLHRLAAVAALIAEGAG